MIPIGWLALSLTWVAPGDEVRLNQIQVIGTHNSYHVAPAPTVRKLVATTGEERAQSLDYTHRPLTEQFTQLGIRQVELDVYADPKGGLFAKPGGRTILQQQGQDPGPDPNSKGTLDKPGMKVLHVPDVDFQTTTPTLIDALTQIRDWSLTHPHHVPILVMIELKADAIPLLPTKPIPFDAVLLDAVDAEIRSVFPAKHLLTPDRIRGTASTLPEAIQTRGWPRLAECRGQVLVTLDNDGQLARLYRDKRPALQGRVMFVNTNDPKDPAAGWFKINDPVKEFDTIQKLVKAGFLVRTRADADTSEARKNDTRRRDRALASGAQFVSTDFPEPRKDWSDYSVRLPNGVLARPNPVNGPSSSPRDLESR